MDAQSAIDEPFVLVGYPYPPEPRLWVYRGPRGNIVAIESDIVDHAVSSELVAKHFNDLYEIKR